MSKDLAVSDDLYLNLREKAHTYAEPGSNQNSYVLFVEIY
jgi:hypothetical protein